MGKVKEPERRAFKSQLKRPPGRGTWTFLTVPFSAVEAFGAKGRIPVHATVNGTSWRSSLLPAGDGSHYLVVGGDVRKRANVAQGETVEVTLELDRSERTVEVPAELAGLLKRRPKARAAFEKLAYSHRKRHVEHILEGKTAETRERRATRLVTSLEDSESGSGG